MATLPVPVSTIQIRLSTGDAIAGTPAQLLTLLSENNVVFNEAGLDNNFRIEGLAVTDLLLIDAGNNSVHIGNSLLTGAGSGDLVMANNKNIRWINAAGTTSANTGIELDELDNLLLKVPATTDTMAMQWAGTTTAVFQKVNSGIGIAFIGESSSDHAAPGGTGCVLYLTDAGGGKTQLMARFPSGAAQQVAVEP